MFVTTFKKIEKFFGIRDRSTTFKKELYGGLSTFLAMAYILAVNPSILSDAAGAGVDFTGVFFLGTVISAVIGTFLMGIVANVPVALAPGLGLNAFIAYTVASPFGLGLNIQTALLGTLLSGVLYVVIAVTPLRKRIIKAVPKNLKLAIAVMIGFFIAYVGLSNMGIISTGAFPITDETGATTIAVSTNTKIGDLTNPIVLIGLVTTVILILLFFFKVKGAIVISVILGVIMLAIAYGAGNTEAGSVFVLKKYGELSKFSQLSTSVWESFKDLSPKILIVIFVCLYIDFFDTTGALVAIGLLADLPIEGPESDKWLKKANIVDGTSTIVGALFLTSTTTSFIESSVGVAAGARTGISSLLIAFLFAISAAAWPIMGPLLPTIAKRSPVTGPSLFLVGILMASQLKHFEWKKYIDIPVLIVTVMIGTLSYSVADGIASGVLVFYLLHVIGFIKVWLNNKNINFDRFKTATRKKLNIAKGTSQSDLVQASSQVEAKEIIAIDYKKIVFNIGYIAIFCISLAYFVSIPFWS